MQIGQLMHSIIPFQKFFFEHSRAWLIVIHFISMQENYARLFSPSPDLSFSPQRANLFRYAVLFRLPIIWKSRTRIIFGTGASHPHVFSSIRASIPKFLETTQCIARVRYTEMGFDFSHKLFYPSSIRARARASLCVYNRGDFSTRKVVDAK